MSEMWTEVVFEVFGERIATAYPSFSLAREAVQNSNCVVEWGRSVPCPDAP